MGIFAGYYSARIYKMFEGKHWLVCTLLTATAYPTMVFAAFLIINIALLLEKSSGAVTKIPTCPFL
jgi:transmembrane 9 superfamily protein 2/4